MTKKVDTILDTKTTFDAIGMMKKKGYRHLPVISNKKVIGILSMRDLYAEANNQLQDSLKQHKDFLFGTGYGG
jgi:CBS domain-containing protein